MMKLLFLGDVVAAIGISAVERYLPELKRRCRPDAVLINGENSAPGNGIDRASAERLFDAGADILTGGNHSFQKKNAGEVHEEMPFLLRPANLAGDLPGHGEVRLDMGKYDLRVINLSGSLFMSPCENPFVYLDRALAESTPRDLTIIDFHAEATSEKQALGFFADGRAALVAGTHTHVQTNDARILPKGTGYITDLGMCGAYNSILGKGLVPCIHNFSEPENRMKITDGEGARIVSGLLAELDIENKRCLSVTPIRIAEE